MALSTMSSSSCFLASRDCPPPSLSLSLSVPASESVSFFLIRLLVLKLGLEFCFVGWSGREDGVHSSWAGDIYKIKLLQFLLGECSSREYAGKLEECSSSK